MEIQERSFWHVALEAMDAEDELRAANEELKEKQHQQAQKMEELSQWVRELMEKGEIQPGRYDWGNQVLCIYENGTCSIVQAPRFADVFKLPGYQEWSEAISGKYHQRSIKEV